MNNRLVMVVIFNIVVVVSVMYATQPLQPLLAQKFNISMVASSYFTAVVLFWLAIAPIIYGYLLEGMSAKKMLLGASIILFLTNMFLGFSTTYEMFLTIRFIEGIIVPAILTSSMTILAHGDPSRVKFNMSLYVASTVLGGLLGRVMSGFIATAFGWQWVFFSLSLALLFGAILVKRQEFSYETNLTKAKVADVVEILKEKKTLMIYVMMFFVFFIFAGILNLLPFRIKDLFLNVSEAKIGALYLGYGSGIIAALLSSKISKILQGDLNTIVFGGGFYTLTVLLFLTENLTEIFILMFLLCLGMFTVHSISSGVINSLYKDRKALTSGLYLTFYYIGGSLGSIVSTIIYHRYGWDIIIYSFAFTLFIVFTLVLLNKSLY